MKKTFKENLETMKLCKICDFGSLTYVKMIYHLNNEHDKSITKIKEAIKFIKLQQT